MHGFLQGDGVKLSVYLDKLTHSLDIFFVVQQPKSGLSPPPFEAFNLLEPEFYF
jgi:hypothetical protein